MADAVIKCWHRLRSAVAIINTAQWMALCIWELLARTTRFVLWNVGILLDALI